MTLKEENVFNTRIDKVNALNIFIPEELGPKSCIRGIYGFFAVKGGEEIPFYVGKSNDIFRRMFANSSHLNDYLRGVRKTELHQNIDSFLKNDYNIEIRVLKKVDYKRDTFEQDANRLALAELETLVEYQDRGFCLGQLSEAVKEKYERIAWEVKNGNLASV